MFVLETRRRLWAALMLLVVTLLLDRAAFAQGNSVITGTVRDASSRAPVADVVITATSPALQGEQIVVTDASGQYRIPQLPPGDYSIRAEKETYKPYARAGVSLRVGSTIRLNVDLLPESIKAEEIVVVGRAPTIDVGSTQTGTAVGSEFVSRIAISPPSVKGSATRSFESVADVAPTAHSDAYGMSISGTTSPENQYIIDGISVNDPGFGTIGTPLSVEFVKEVQVITGGYLPEYGRATGGVLDVVTRSGSNEFHGSVFMSFTPGALEGAREPIRREGQTITTDVALSSLRDFGAELGGPILKDKLWFYVGVQPSFASYSVNRRLNRIVVENDATKKDPATGFTVTEPISGTSKAYRANQFNLQYIGKLTYLINQDQNITLTVLGGPSSSGGNGEFGITPSSGEVEVADTGILGSYAYYANEHSSTSNAISLKYAAAFMNKSLLFDATLGWHHGTRNLLPPDGSGVESGRGLSRLASVIYRRTPDLHNVNEFEPVPGNSCDPVTTAAGKQINVCPVTTYGAGGPGLIETGLLDRYQGKLIVTRLLTALGHHVVKAGVDVELMSFDHNRVYTGTTVFRENDSGTAFADYRRYGYAVGPDEAVIGNADVTSSSTSIGAFLQDSWSILDKVTLNAGLRYDAQILSATQVLSDESRVGLVLPNQWSPRVGVIYDFTQSGRSKLFVNFARYYENVPLDLADRSLTLGGQARATHNANPTNGRPVCDPRTYEGQQGACADPANLNVVNGVSDPNQHWRVSGGNRVPIDPDIKPQSTDEIAVGGEYEVVPDGRVGLQYTKRYMNSIIEDMSLDEGQQYFLGNPGEGIATNFPKATRDYDAVTVYFNKVFSNSWLAQVSYTLSSLRGNWAGLFRPETKQLDPNINSDFDILSLLVNRDGPLPGDRTHQLKAFGAKDFTVTSWLNINAGLTYRASSGEPTNYLGSHVSYGSDEAFILPRGSGERLPWVHSFDTHVGFAVKLAKESELTFGIDVFNLFNFQAVTAVDNTYTRIEATPIPNGEVSDLPAKGATTCEPPACKLTKIDGELFDPAAVNPNYGNPTRYQPPRTFRFSARVNF